VSLPHVYSFVDVPVYVCFILAAKAQYNTIHVTWPKGQLLGQSVLLKFTSETRLESESFEALIDFLAFLVQKL